MKNIIPLVSSIVLLFAQNEMDGRWYLVGYEESVMYQFVDTEPYADAGLRYTIYSMDGNFPDLGGGSTGGTPNPYIIIEDIITIDLHFGNEPSYQINFRCDGQVVDFYYQGDDWEGVHSTLYREGFDYSLCDEIYQECFDLSGIDFGLCDMFLGIGWDGYECEYFSGCGWAVDNIDYSSYFFDSIQECESSCECEDGDFINHNPCNPMECFNGQWYEIIIDCAEEMGVPCDGGLYIPPNEGECCSKCILFGDINYDYGINILDAVGTVQLVLDGEYSEIADINLDSTINILDIVEIIQIILD